MKKWHQIVQPSWNFLSTDYDRQVKVTTLKRSSTPQRPALVLLFDGDRSPGCGLAINAINARGDPAHLITLMNAAPRVYRMNEPCSQRMRCYSSRTPVAFAWPDRSCHSNRVAGLFSIGYDRHCRRDSILSFHSAMRNDRQKVRPEIVVCNYWPMNSCVKWCVRSMRNAPIKKKTVSYLTPFDL
jgi:hypothetical protein